MIQGNRPRRIKQYLPIDHCGEGAGYVRPAEGIELLGFPWGWFGNDSPPFIEHRRGNEVVRSVNCADVSEIEFDAESRHT